MKYLDELEKLRQDLKENADTGKKIRNERSKEIENAIIFQKKKKL